jgi:hypothetical protein
MFQHRMQHRFHHGWQRGPHGSRWGGRGGFGPGRRFGPNAFNAANPEVRSLIGDVRDLGRYLFRQGASGAFKDTEKVRQLRDIVARTRTEIETLFGPENSTAV